MLLFLKFRTICLNILLHTKMWWHRIYRFLTLFLETENSINSHNLISLIRQVLDFAPVKVSLKLHFSCVHLMKGNQKIANFYEKKSKSFQQSFQSKIFVLSKSFVLSHSCGIFSFFHYCRWFDRHLSTKILELQRKYFVLFSRYGRPGSSHCFLVNSIAKHRPLKQWSRLQKSVQKTRFCLKINHRLAFIHHKSLESTFVLTIAIFSISSN